MPDLLLELFSEEIPARMQAGAARDLERLVVGALTERGLLFEGIKAFAGPRRLTLAVAGLPAKQRDVREELKGPKVDAPQPAIDGFLKKTGLTKDQLKVEKTAKGDVYIAVIEREGRPTPDVLAEILPEAMAKLPWPKSMRWKPNDPVRWVRPLHSILATFDGEVVPFAFAGIQSGNVTRGHRFLSSGEIAVRRYDDYAAALHKAHVVLDAEQRKAIIFEGVKQAAFVHGLELIPDEGLLNEVAGLAEWPVVLIGTIENQFMDVPAEILQTSMRTHQKYFSLWDPKTGKMANRFALVANMIAEDGGKEIVAGNERVLRARLSDAKFFWDEDRKHSLESRVEALKGVVFHSGIGTVFQRVQRISKLAQRIAELLKYPREVSLLAMRAGLLAKSDLVTGIVGEFPELQGIMGRYYATGEPQEVAMALGEQYSPKGDADHIPDAPVSVSLAIAEKIDTLVELWYAGEKPSGSGDPFALRRATLGVIRILLGNRLRLPLKSVIRGADFNFEEDVGGVVGPPPTSELLAFFADRLKVILKKDGVRHDLIDAVFSLGTEDDLVRLVARVEALQSFLKTDDGTNLLVGYKRAVNILKAEEKKGRGHASKEVNTGLLTEKAEHTLFKVLVNTRIAVLSALQEEDFIGAMRELAKIREPVDAFFESVKVNADDPDVRTNRLQLLAELQTSLHRVADFSKIEG